MGESDGRFSSLEGKPGLSPDHVALESGLFEWRESIRPEVRTSYPRPEPTPEQLAESSSGDPPLATVVTPLPNRHLLSRAVGGLLDAVKPAKVVSEYLTEWLGVFAIPDSISPGTSDRTHTPDESLHTEVERWFTAAWMGDIRGLEETAAKSGLSVEQAEWAGRQLARPFFHRLGEVLAAHQSAEPEAKVTAGCPCCGGAPRLGLYSREEGKRYLWCDLCDLKWRFLRVTCAFCLNRNHEKLGYLTIESLDGYRIDVCEVCRGYLRAADERGMSDDRQTDFLLEDVGTFHLCLVAEDQGWRQGRISRGAEARTGPIA